MKQKTYQGKKPFLLISDFDGTVSEIDFFWQILNRRFPNGESSDYSAYLEKKIFAFELLSKIFRDMGMSEAELDEEISSIKIDKSFTDTAKWILTHGGDICILSAGCDYYIKRRLQKEGLGEIPVISNHGVYSDGGICMERMINSPWYNENSGIDKGKATADLKKDYAFTAYAGDGTFDAPAARITDLKFAKRQLEAILKKENTDYYLLTGFDIIREVLEKQNIL